MSTGSATQSNDSFASRLNEFRRRIIRIDTSFCVLLFALSLVIGLSCLLWFDTIVALPSTVRWYATRVGSMVIGFAFSIAAWLRVRKWTFDRIADRVDRTTQSGGEFLAGWQLATRPIHPASELSKGFASIATRKAAEKLRTIPPSSVVDANALRRPALMLVIAIVLVALVALVAPSVVWHQTQRFLFPERDIPPYTGIVIELELEKDRILYGQDAMIKAKLHHGRVDRMVLIVESESNSDQSLPMLAQSETAWNAVLTRVTQPLTIYARSGNSRSQKHRLEVQLTPQILPPKVTITPPRYTRTNPYRGVIPEQGFVGLAGTRVDWHVSSNRPLRSGRLALLYRDGTQESIELLPEENSDTKASEAPNFVTGMNLLSKSGQFELSVTDIDGIESQENVTGSITIIPDQRPIVRILQPQPISIATPDVAIPVSVIAEDDYGISSLTLYRSLNGSAAIPSNAVIGEDARIQHGWELPLPRFGLVPGDEIKLFARTEDNDPAGPKGAESPMTTIRIISVEDFQKMMIQQKGAESLQAKYRLARRFYDQLASALREVDEASKALAENPESPELAEKLKAKLDAAQKSAEQAASEIAKLSQQPMPIDVDRELIKQLEELSEQAEEMAEQLQAMQENASPNLDESDQQQLKEMLDQASGAQEDLSKQAIEPLDQLQKTMPLMIDQQRFVQIVEQQTDLAERLKGLEGADPNDPATQRRVAELETQQEQLKQELQQLLEDIEQHAQNLPENEDTEKLKQTSIEFVDAVRQSQASNEMANVQNQLLSDEFKNAQASAQQAAETLSKFLSQCNGMGDAAGQQCKAAFNPSRAKLGNSIDQMLQMMGAKGRSGMKPGSQPGMGMGWGAGGGYSQRFAGPQNIGMYGTMPNPQTSPSRGQSNQQSQGIQTSQAIDSSADGAATRDTTAKGESSGQSMNTIPANYRSKVADYLRQLSEQIGNAEANAQETPK